MLAPSLASRGFPCGGRSALRRQSAAATTVFGSGTAGGGCSTQRQCFLRTVCSSLSLSSERPSNQVPDPRSLSEPFPSTFLPQFSPFPSFSAYSQGKDFLLVLQGRWALLYLPCQDHSSPLAQLSSQCCPGEVLSSPRYS